MRPSAHRSLVFAGAGISLVVGSLGSLGSADEQRVRLLFAPRPHTQMKTVTEVRGTNSLTVDGSDEVLAQFTARGMTFPLETSTTSRTVSTIRFGDREPNGAVAFEFSINAAKGTTRLADGRLVDVESPMSALIGVTGAGIVTPDVVYELQSLQDTEEGGERFAAVAAVLRQMTESARAQPTEPLEPGDSFTLEMPLSIPVPDGPPFEMTVDQAVVLDSIEGGKAEFSTSWDAEATAEPGTAKIEMRGSGVGELHYGVQARVYEKQLDTSRWTIKIEAGGAVMTTDSTTEVEITSWLIED